MIKSMTGYGRAKKETTLFSVTVEMKSVNHRFCEIAVRMPRQLLMFEDKMKRTIQKQLSRGKVDVFITLEGEGAVNRDIEVDWSLLDTYYNKIMLAKNRYKLTDSIELSELLKLEDAFTIVEKESAADELEGLLLECVEEAAQRLVSMRKTEGKLLLNDVVVLLNQVSAIVNHLMIYKDSVIERYQQRLQVKMDDFLNDNQAEIDESRLLQEVALFADKADINEELTRLKSHIEQFETTVYSDEAVGRKLDFLVQEMNREMNTIGSKANDAEISHHVVEMKSILEKIKEQVQNIE